MVLYISILAHIVAISLVFTLGYVVGKNQTSLLKIKKLLLKVGL